MWRRWIPFAAAAAGVSLIVWAVFFWSSDEDEILARLAQLVESVRVRPTETNVAIRVLRIRGDFQEIFVPEVRVRIPELTSLSTGRRELADVAGQAGNYYKSADVSLGDVRVAIDAGKTGARVQAEAVITAEPPGGEVRRDQREVEFAFEKIDGDWRITSIGVSPRAAEGEAGE